MPVPTSFEENENDGVPPNVTTSFPTTPDNAAVPLAVADVKPSYTLSTPDRPVTVSSLSVMSALSVGCANV